MNKSRFQEIVSNYTTTSEDINALKQLTYDYPFSQILHILLANATKKGDKREYQSNLASAAIYSTDRSILKNLINDNLRPINNINLRSTPHHPSTLTSPERIISDDSNLSQSVKEIDEDTQSHTRLSTNEVNNLITEVYQNLERLKKTKKKTSSWLKNINLPKKTKKKITSPKIAAKKKQSTIIDNFIIEKPSISKNKNKKSVSDKEENDMAKESGEMRDDIISESLAEIFVNQGKNKQAVMLYKKLIVKTPQKKALFLKKIELLNKK